MRNWILGIVATLAASGVAGGIKMYGDLRAAQERIALDEAKIKWVCKYAAAIQTAYDLHEPVRVPEWE